MTFFSLDITTLALARGMMQMMLGGLLLSLGSRYLDVRDGRWWAFGFFINGVSLFVFPLEVPPDWQLARLLLNHLGLGASSAFFLIGFWKFGHQRMRYDILLLMILIPALSLTLWEWLWPNDRYRIMFSVAGQLIYLYYLQQSLSQPPREEFVQLYSRMRWAVLAYVLINLWSYGNIVDLLPTSSLQSVAYHRSFFSVATLLFMLLFAVGCLALQFTVLANRNADLALKDWLTGLNNRRGFFRALDAKLKTAVNLHAEKTLLAIDIDHFKPINDKYGHAIGDVVLQEFSAYLQTLTHSERIIARIGGEEFLIMQFAADQAACSQFAEQIRRDAEAMQVRINASEPLRFTVSIGVHQIQPDESIEHALISVDDALYTAKNQGRNQVARLAEDHAPGSKRHFRALSRQREI